ncbi:Retrovirus-related Pol polyprotein from transposon 17.6 [Labeo rohita]|uniref:Gypsy retrotransposon integrase-like protein 1 n=1 Tax=Labeo rohita TaxID=84645 RepID=A0ABQ8MVY6_LABRO|nr:Retrovirus-related Pol polyprotein from transposon 17.6 [Labeo rohita]
MDSELTLAKAIQKVRQSETVKKQQTIIHSAAGVDPKTNVDAIKTMRRGKKFQYTGKQRNKDQKFDTPSGKECGRCGKGRKHTSKDCPAKDVECRKCHKKGHFAVACRNGQAVYTVTEVLSDSDSQDYAFLGEVSTQTTKPWIEKVTLNGDAISFKLDTGADVTSIPDSVFDPKRDGKLDKPLKRLVGPGKHLLDIKGCFQGKMCAKGRSTDQPVYVVAGLTQPLLGLPAIQAMRLVHRVNEVTQADTDFKALYPSVFQGLEYLYLFRDKVREELERMECMGVISKVTEPTAWCSGMVVVPKPMKNKLRICVDLTPLNAAVKRERHILPAVDQTLAMMSDAKVFTKLDARSGFWQIPLTPESRPLTTFITLFGRYFFNRLPFGIASASEHFQRRMSQMFENFEGVLCHADDVLVYGRNRQEHDQRLHRVLQKMQEEGLTLNEKCEFRQEHITFVWHRVSSKGIEPDPNKLKAILQMPEPTQVEDVRRLMGMANYLSKFVPQMAITMPLKDLLREKNEWVWGEPQQTAFKKLKSGLSSPKALAQYSNTAETKVAADASPYGIGAILTQKQADNSWQPVTYISRGLTDTEKRYAQIEKEALAVTWACERLTSYLQGLHFTLQTDHKPLVPLLSTRGLDDLPSRVLRFRLRLLRYDYNIVHVPGKNLITADTLSRAPLTDTPSAEDLQLEKEVQVFVDAVVSSLPVTDTRLEKIKQAQQTDETCKTVARYCQTALPQKHRVSTGIIPYWQVRAELYLVGDLLMKGDRIVIPQTLRGEILHKLHEGHQGIPKCHARAQASVWWPGISAQI